MSIGEADRTYIGAALRSVWFYISVSLGLIGLLERWRAMPFLVPHWAIFSLIIVSLIGAHFELYKKTFEEMRTLSKKCESTALQEKEYQDIRSLFENYGEIEKSILRNLLRHGKMIKHVMGKLSPLPGGCSEEAAASVLDKLVTDNLVTSETRLAPGGYEVVRQIALGAKSAIEELLGNQ